MSRKYVIIEVSDVPSVNFDEVLQTSEKTLRHSTDGTKTLVKFDGATPSFLAGNVQYNYSEISNILNGEEWSTDSV
ncbi:MAG: hypothetical protein CMD99_03325 [Gammaproteobacteria bacterium]|nr:hypothetical protein [Gammaproteobacteria bacterium]|tara:strand:+ start:656 stop:883 length:228 start_codon:yes stop_codon:yes gene_type:complete